MSLSTTHVLETEQNLLATMMAFPETIDEAEVEPEDFLGPDHQLICKALFELRDKGADVNPVTVYEHLSGRVSVESITSIATGALQAPSAVEGMARTVRRVAIRRRIAEAGRKITAIAEQSGDLDETIAEVERVLSEAVNAQTGKDAMAKLSDVMIDCIDSLLERVKQRGKLPGLPTGSRDLDRITGGYHPSELVIVAARPSMGKTAWMLHSARAAASAGVAVIFSLEMDKQQLAERYLAATSSVPMYVLRTGLLHEQQWPLISHAAAELSEPNLYIDDTSVMTTNHIRAQLRRIRRKFPDKPLVAFVDYLQIVAEKGRSQAEEYGAIAAALKATAKELQCTVVALCQLNRECERRQDKRPVLSDVRGSGEIEQAADIVIGLYRDAYYNPDTADKYVSELIVLKHRNGPTGTVRMYFDERLQKFADLAQAERAAG